jgi:hypothetical protein
VVHCNFWRPSDPDANSYILDDAVFYCNNQFRANGLSYAEVHLSGNVSLFSNGAYELLEIAPGTDLTIESGSSHDVSQMIVAGTADNIITIRATEPGNEAYFEGYGQDVNGVYLDIQDNHASGSANFIANNSTLGSNVEGWQIPGSTEEHSRSIRVYPNPVNDQLNLEVDQPGVFVLLDLEGREVIREQFFTAGIGQLSLSDLSPGCYILRSESNRLKPLRILKQ